MVDKKKQDVLNSTKPIFNSPTLNYEEYYKTLMLAKKIRSENIEILNKAQTSKEKTKLLEQLFMKYNIPGQTSSDAKEREQAILLKVNIFIPDSNQFALDYKSKYNKNIRLISEAYQIPAPFAISKVSEIGKYEQFLNRIEKEGELKEPKLDTDPSIISSKTLYDSPISDSVISKKEKKSKKKKKSDIPTHSKINEVAPKIPEDVTPEIAVPLQEVVNEELIHHIGSMQRYCTRLLDQNEQLGSQNTSLLNFKKELEILLGKIKAENNILKEQIASFSKENADLKDQISKLSEENVTLTSQIYSAKEKINISHTITDETAIEKELRQEIKTLQFRNQELNTQVQEEKDKKDQYRTRAVVAEVQLEQLQHGMQGIFKEVDALDISLAVDTPKKS